MPDPSTPNQNDSETPSCVGSDIRDADVHIRFPRRPSDLIRNQLR
jgi:hypothetical protein